MTIRTQLIAAAFVSSGIVALATSASALFLHRASSHLHGIRSEMIPMVTRAGGVENNAGKLAQSMEVFSDSKMVGEAGDAATTYTEIAAEFRDLHASVDYLAQHVSSLRSHEHDAYRAEIARFRRAARSLDADWARLRDVGPTDQAFKRVTQFDDDAIRLFRSSAGLQESALVVTSNRVEIANTYVVWVSRLSAIIAGCMSILTLATGVSFASSLAKRLGRVRDQAKRVGGGNLDATLEVRGTDEIDDIAVSFNDMVKALRGSREKLERDALYDGLTGLPNRMQFLQRLSRCVAEAKSRNAHAYAVYFLDVDRFKEVNDTFGHDGGDEVLRAVAGRLTAAVSQFPWRAAITRTVARLAGDEFTLLLEGEVGPQEALGLGERIREVLRAPVNIEGTAVAITASIGVALGSGDIADPKDILTRADVALYHTKRQGRDGCSLYTASMGEADGCSQERRGTRARRGACTASPV